MCAEIMIAIAFHESQELFRNLLIQAKRKALTTEGKLTKLRPPSAMGDTQPIFLFDLFCYSTGNWGTLFGHFFYDWCRGRHRRPWDTPSDLANKDLLYIVRSLQSYKINLIFIFLIKFTKFSSTIFYRLYERKVPNNLTCSFVLSNSNILERMCFIVRNQIALLLLSFHFKHETFPNQSINWRCNLRESTLPGFIAYVYLQIEKILLLIIW